MAAIRKRLSDHVGGSPSATEMILIELSCILALRVALLSDVVLSSAAIDERDDRQLVSWINSLARIMDRLKGAAAAPPSITDLFPAMRKRR